MLMSMAMLVLMYILRVCDCDFASAFTIGQVPQQKRAALPKRERAKVQQPDALLEEDMGEEESKEEEEREAEPEAEDSDLIGPLPAPASPTSSPEVTRDFATTPRPTLSDFTSRRPPRSSSRSRGGCLLLWRRPPLRKRSCATTTRYLCCQRSTSVA